MIEKNIQSLTIHELSQTQYNNLVNNNELDSDSIYLVKDEETLIQEITKNSSHNEIASAKAVYDLCTKLIQEALNK